MKTELNEFQIDGVSVSVDTQKKALKSVLPWSFSHEALSSAFFANMSENVYREAADLLLENLKNGGDIVFYGGYWHWVEHLNDMDEKLTPFDELGVEKQLAVKEAQKEDGHRYGVHLRDGRECFVSLTFHPERRWWITDREIGIREPFTAEISATLSRINPQELPQ